MDIFTVPDPNDPMMGYAYLMTIFVLIAASFTVYKMKKSKKSLPKEEPQAFDMYEDKIESKHESDRNE
ncbi:hypothetical protein [Salisediminibacterium selenitireducens]|uniref:Uncharacterized protein n=1 Tax=Bacillus selenitireducens (strain ATCC 700615 / DSM 15326 / MLS10) TaxID=439292 RepID=D6XX50_BACIE|nr:hypothetical protein [Salisediminibacterium selenitireducens]ADI00027.1 hypothetical protein Bsel_2525 [[Bacillus] selenitireducens MLS10]